LAGGGLAVLYVTIAIAFHVYEMFEGIEAIAFIIMVIITAFAVLLSILYDKKELAVFAILGGFATPFMVSTGSGNYKILFIYITILDIGMLILAYYKKWNIVNVISYIFTILLFGGWLTREFIETEEPPFVHALIFATIFYLIFFVMNIINNLTTGKKFKALEISILLSNTFLYYAAGMIIIHELNTEYKGLFTALVAIFNFIFAYFTNKPIPSTIITIAILLIRFSPINF
jgi:uncharacterized membrane protein